MVFHIIVCEAYNVNAGAALVLGNLICAQIAIYGSATIVGAPIAAALGSVCAVMNTSLALSCSILPKLADDLCANSAFKKFSITGQELTIRPILMGPDGMIEGNFLRIDVREPFPDMRLDLGDEYEHFVKISLDYNTCPNTNINNEVYIDGILVGRLTATNPNIISKIKNGDHIINLGANGQNITVNGGVSISLPCYGVSDKPLDQPFVCVNR